MSKAKRESESQKEHTAMKTVFFFNDPATTEIYPLSLHDALPISDPDAVIGPMVSQKQWKRVQRYIRIGDRKSTRLNSRHVAISYPVFCLKKNQNAGRRQLISRAVVTFVCSGQHSADA